MEITIFYSHWRFFFHEKKLFEGFLFHVVEITAILSHTVEITEIYSHAFLAKIVDLTKYFLGESKFSIFPHCVSHASLAKISWK